ncbi:MAG TPA: hypothetical protein VFW11_04780 [Cyclobacteriaceae bacterium]|nr:hypothetical protein [Cyclobacteriaceae bacterium]
MKTLRFNRFCAVVSACAFMIAVNSCGDDEGSSNVNDITVKSISPDSPAVLKFYQTSSDDRVYIEYDYNISHKEGARIWIVPYTDGDFSPGYIYSSSPVYKGKGSKKVLISIDESAEPVNVDQLQIYIESEETEEVLVERYVDVDYTFE